MWYLRTLPNIKKSFSGIWEDDDLLVSFDGCGVFRPVEYLLQFLFFFYLFRFLFLSFLFLIHIRLLCKKGPALNAVNLYAG